LANVLAKHAAKRAGAAEAFLVDEKGMVTEGTSTSALLIKDGILRTAPLRANILPGITRALILEWAGNIGLAVREESFTVSEALEADELLLCGTTSAVMGISELNGHPIAEGKVGKYTQQLRLRLERAIEEGID